MYTNIIIELDNCINIVKQMNIDQFGNLDKMPTLVQDIKSINKALKLIPLDKKYLLTRIWSITSNTGNSWDAMERKLVKVRDYLKTIEFTEE